ncbi:MAG: GGDEF domain-containing protein [Methylophaga sp.]
MILDQLDFLTRYLDMLLDAVCVVDSEGHFLYVSAGGERIFGYTAEEMIGRRMLEMVHPGDREPTLRVVDTIMSGNSERVDFENRYIRKDGRIVHILWSAHWAEEDGIRVAVARDITHIRHTEARQTALFSISEATHTELTLPDLYKRIHEIVAGLMPMQHFVIGLFDEQSSQAELVYQSDSSQQKDQQKDLETLCIQVAKRGESWPETMWEKNAMPDWLAVPLKSQDGIVGTLMVKTDSNKPAESIDECELLEFVSTQIAAAISRRKMLESLHQLAMFDPLTGLPNRRLFQDRFQQMLARAKRNQEHFAVIYLDLDKFKQVNDHFGHEAGDRVLRQTAERLNACLRDTDTVARMGGDEFVMILDEVGATEVQEVVEKLLAVLSPPYRLDDKQCHLSVSIGVACFPEDGETQMALLQEADNNMYRTKHADNPSLES